MRHTTVTIHDDNYRPIRSAGHDRAETRAIQRARANRPPSPWLAVESLTLMDSVVPAPDITVTQFHSATPQAAIDPPASGQVS